MKSNVIKIHSRDNVVVVLKNIGKYDKAILSDECQFDVQDDIPYAHKVALHDIKNGEEIIKYGSCIGIATEDIKKGSWVHAHNINSDVKVEFS